MANKVAQAEIRAQYLGYLDESDTEDGVAKINLDTGEVARAGASGPEAAHVPDIASGGNEGDYLILTSGVWTPTAPPAGGYTFPYHSDGSDSSAIGGTTTETEFDTTGFTLPADAFETAGDFLTVEFSGLIQSIGIGGSITIRLKSDSSTLATAFNVNAPGSGVEYFHARGIVTATTIGSSGEVRTNWTLRSYAEAFVNSSNRVTLSVDTESSMDIGITGQWSSAVASNQARIHQVSYVLHKVVT